MLVDELQEVMQLDQKISSIHDKLHVLYQERSRLISGSSRPSSINSLNKSTTGEPVASKSWTSQIYTQVTSEWEKFGLRLPSKAQFQRRLDKAYAELENLKSTSPLIAEQMKLVVIPPKSAFNLSKIGKYRQTQGLANKPDRFSDGISISQHKHGWKLTLIYAGAEGLLLDEINIDDYARLSVCEYLALSLQSNALLDTKSWTLLPAEERGNQTVTVTYTGVKYLFELDDAASLIGDNRIRPVIELK